MAGHVERFELTGTPPGEPERPAWPTFAVGEGVHVLEASPSDGGPVCRAAVVLAMAEGDEDAPPMLRCRVLRPTNAVGMPVGHWDGEGWYGYRVPSSQGYGAHKIGDCS